MLTIVVAAIFVFVVAFLIGSIPFGQVIAKVFFHTDLREHGSGNIGATNAMRVLGKKVGAAVFVLDALKGAGATFIGWAVGRALLNGSGANSFAGMSIFTCMAFLAVILGHCFSPWLNWKGGKGIAAAGGALFVVLGPLGGILELVGFALVTAATRFVSLGSLTATWLLLPFSAYRFLFAVPAGQNRAWIAFILCLAGIIVVTWAHRGNIARLRSGTENRLGSKEKNSNGN